MTGSNSGWAMENAAPYSEQAAKILREEILAGRYEPGQRLNEMELSHQLGISRSPIREGMRKLADEGLVILAPRRGAFVATFEHDQVGELMEFRQAIDVMAAHLAARRATEEQRTQMQIALEAATVAHQGAAAAAPPWKSDFHILILQASQNRKIIERGTEVHTQLHLARFRSGSLRHRAQQAHDEHQTILDRIRAKDSKGAGAAMWDHLEHATEHIRQVVDAE